MVAVRIESPAFARGDLKVSLLVDYPTLDHGKTGEPAGNKVSVTLHPSATIASGIAGSVPVWT